MNQKFNTRRFDDGEIRCKVDLIKELQVCEKELEIRNHEFRLMQQQLKIARDRLDYLYDYAPVGYLTLNIAGDIKEINLTACTMLNVERKFIVDKAFVTYVSQGDHQKFFRSLEKVFNSSDSTVVELGIEASHRKAKYFRLESLAVEGASTCHMVIIDINQLRKTKNNNLDLLHGNRRVMQNIFKNQEEERRLLACELHDELGQWLTAINAEAETISNCADKDSTVYACSQAIGECGKEMHTVMRTMLHQLRPALLDALGLADALYALKKAWCKHHKDISLKFKLQGELEKLGELINITIYRIIQEALNNICSHSDATQASVFLSHEVEADSSTDRLILRVEDNGKGYNADPKSSGLGLLGMRERAIAAGGEFSIHSKPNKGTQIYVELSLNQPAYLSHEEEATSSTDGLILDVKDADKKYSRDPTLNEIESRKMRERMITAGDKSSADEKLLLGQLNEKRIPGGRRVNDV